MWNKFLLLGIKKESFLDKNLTKEQIYKEIRHRVQRKRFNSYDLEKLYKYVINKKYNNNTIIESGSGNNEIQNMEEIQGYRNIIHEEEYVTRFITEKYNRETSISNWKMNLYLLKGNYSDILKDKSIDIGLINSYIEGYSFVDNAKNSSFNKIRREISTISAYSPEKAVEYAITYAFNYNTAKYPSYAGKGGDCANFISQALNAGGKPMVGINSTNFSNWFCRSNQLWDVNKISSTWRGADAFGHYWMTRAVSYRNFDSSHFKEDSKFKKVLSYGNRGDAVSLLNSNGRPFHTLIIIDYSKDDLICAAHSNDTINASLRDYGFFSGGGIRVYKMSE
ncbi:amidase domain-containing protein [Proteiniborus sp. MB09-C3]|uniref:amidase domain-containing protein n=1 Tax=Proteiniborus sp. MB09-C3 TaxID=3050072 RepID=UPI002552191F|nr:amidase domain-containing protein [Proteiniborus sp. MB09-C3]WIV11901.1 amidase domain-containing protein [Proteiniborus sp. MB09-C3]